LVTALLNLSENANRVLNTIKVKYQLKDKSQAVECLVDKYIDDSDDRELRPEFIRDVLRASKEKGILVETSLAERYGRKDVHKGHTRKIK
jgi:hypothetical protein